MAEENIISTDLDSYPKGKYAVETEELQTFLASKGYYPSDEIDGWMGPNTANALGKYLQELRDRPLPVKPWWESSRGKGFAKIGIGALVSIVGFFWAGASNINVSDAVEIIYTAGPQIDQLVHMVKSIIEIGGALLVALGFGQTAIGAIRAKQPLDTTLVARINNKDIRLPSISQKKKTPTEESHDIWLNNSY